MIDNVGGRSITAGTAEPFGTSKTFDDTARIMNTAITVVALLLAATTTGN